ncbi:TetR/AcrR family transcriptional regulator [Geodermatophilus sabuli]|uniref:TetR/AcrR family transcriptional regulator n=1 Tax=Geodermatophilus sabuli TaxID=1564158 RepID=A0A7K3W2Z3_9ACTN|nr:TetR/AcrR family transcriptional regulator [Geodermatophilus sabuli]
MTVGDGLARSGTVLTRTRTSARRLDRTRDEAIATAVIEVLGREGYAGLTMDAVALAAGVGKATIYRRWSSKADLLLSVLDVAGESPPVHADTGDLRDDLVAVLLSTLDLLAGPSGRATRSLLGALVDDPALARAFQAGPLARWDAAWTAVLDRAVDRGEITPAAAGSVVAELAPAVLCLRWLVTGRELDTSVVEEIVDRVVLPLLRGW